MLGTSLTLMEESYKKVKYWKKKTQRNNEKNQHNFTKGADTTFFLVKYLLFNNPYVNIK